ncbi:MAG: hypothetical protein MJ239_02740, partial [Bacilli bacterium]|nr:hypothetical protein [Bacilli bacterium]
MKKILPYIVFLIVSSLFGALAFYMSGNLIFFIGVTLVYFLECAFLILPMEKKRSYLEKKRHQAFRFVSSFVVSYSLSLSYERAYGNAIEGYEGEYQEIIEAISMKGVGDRIRYLASYFESNLYDLFVNLLDIFENQGGDPLSVFSGIMEEFSRLEESEDALLREKKRTLKEVALLWFFAFLIFVFMRFGLNSFYDDVKSSLLYIGSMALFFAFFA